MGPRGSPRGAGDRPSLEDALVLVVDGDARAVATGLERAQGSLTVRTSGSATAALDRLDEGTVDCVVSEYDLPEMDGLAFCERVREARPHLPFVLFTGAGSEAVAAEAIGAGVTDYVRKADGYDALADRVVEAVASGHGDWATPRRRFDRFVDAVTEYAIFTLDAAGHVTSWNRGAARMKGYEADEILGEHFSVFYPAERVAEGYPSVLLGRARENGSVEDLGWRVRADGTRFWAHVTITAISDDEGRHRGYIKVVEDQTDRHEAAVESEAADHAADVSKDLLSRAVDEAAVGITITGSAAEDAPLVYVNEGFVRMTGYPRSEVIGRNCRFLQGEGTDEEPVRELREAVESERTATVELRNYREDGTEFWNRVTVSPLRDASGTVTHFVGVQEDVTAGKRKERQLERQLDQFEAFGSVLSHDVKTPLNVVEGHLQLAAETGDEAHFEKARAGLDRLTELLDDLATVLREGELVGDETAVSLGETARDIWDPVGTDHADLVVADDVTVRASRNALARMLENLFTNAVEHGTPVDSPATGDAGEPATLTVTVGALPTGFYVADDGSGIPPSERADAFEFGYSTKDADAGTGLGLASVRQIAVAHGWDVALTESAEGGARFEFTDVEVV
ncbi:MAG: PAS domain-containing protein [Halobacteriaceae archaeon]